MESINPWTRIPTRASFEEAFDDSDNSAYQQQPPPPDVSPEPELPPAVAQFSPSAPGTGLGLWAGEPPAYIPAELLAPGDSEDPPRP